MDLRCRLFLLLPCPSERLWYGPLREVDTKGIHVETIHEAGEALAEAGQALMHELEMHHVGLEVGHGIRQLSKGGLEGIERE